MNRRQFVPASATLAGAVLVGSLPLWLNKKALAYSVPGWKENSTTTSLESLVSSRFSKVKAKLDVYALNADEWGNTANMFQALADEHSRLGNLHKLDLVIAANQAALIKKYGSTAIDDLLKNGSHAAFTNVATKYHAVALKLGGATPEFNMSCDKAYAMMVVELDATAMILAEVPPIAIALGLCSIAAGIAGIFMCP